MGIGVDGQGVDGGQVDVESLAADPEGLTAELRGEAGGVGQVSDGGVADG